MDMTSKAKGTITAVKDRKKLKEQLLEQVKATAPDKRWNRAKKLTKVIDEIIYKATDRGFSFNGKQTLMELCECKGSTIDEATRLLKESGLFEVAYRENPNSNGYKTPVFILKSHANYQYIKEILEIQNYKQVVKQEVEKAQTSSGTRDSEEKEVPTNLSLKKDILTKKINNNNEDNYRNQLKDFFTFGLSENQLKAKELIDKNPYAHETVKLKSRAIVKELPSQFSELDWSVFADLMLLLYKKQPKHAVSYVVKAFYKNKLVQADQLGLSLDSEHIPDKLLPKSFKAKKRIAELKIEIEKYRKAGQMDYVRLYEHQIDIEQKKAGNSRCIVNQYSLN